MEAFYAALLNFAARFGIEAAISFLQNRGATIDDAIAALEMAKTKSLEDYIREDAAARIMKAVPPSGEPYIQTPTTDLPPIHGTS